MKSLAAVLMSTLLLAPTHRPSASLDPTVELTIPSAGGTVSVSSPYVITWTARDVPDDAMLSLRFTYITHDIAVTVNGQPMTNGTLSNSLITSLLTESGTRKLFELMKTPMPANVGVIETGTYSWDLPHYCPKNTMNGKTICQKGMTFQIVAILRARNDPCADRETCDQPRRLFKRTVSEGRFTFAE
jgi:hypothetical protein